MDSGHVERCEMMCFSTGQVSPNAMSYLALANAYAMQNDVQQAEDLIFQARRLGGAIDSLAEVEHAQLVSPERRVLWFSVRIIKQNRFAS